MKYFWSLIVVGTFAAQVPLGAQETPNQQLEFIRKLRAKGFDDLALEKLEELKKTIPADLQPILLVEMGRSKIAMARHKSADEKLALAAAVEKELQDFVAKNAGKPGAAIGRLELARLTNFQGQAWLNKAYRQEDRKVGDEQAKKAEEFFIRAIKELEAAEKEVAEDDKLQVRFDRGISLIDQARANFHLQDFSKGGENMQAARKILEEVVNQDNASGTGMLAAAWLINASTEGQDWNIGERMYKEVMKQNKAEARPAQRWARLFYMQRTLKYPGIAPPKGSKIDTNLYKQRKVQTEGEDWLASYKSFRNSPEGIAVRFELAQAYFEEGKFHLSEIKDPKKGPKDAKEKAAKEAAMKIFGKAQKMFAELAETDNDFSEKSNQHYRELASFRMSEMKLSELKTFDESYLKALYEIGRLGRVMEELRKETGEEKAGKLQKERKEILKDTVKAIQRALSLADVGTKTPSKKINEARLKLLEVYYTMGDMTRAAFLGEMLAREEPLTKQAPLGAGYAIEAYGKIQPKDETRLRNLVMFVTEDKFQKAFPNDPVVGMARFHLANHYQQEEKFVEAIKQLELLPKNYPAYNLSKSQIVLIALTAREYAEKDWKKADDKDVKAKKAKEMKDFENIARAGFKDLTLPANPDSHTAYSYFSAQIQHCKFIYLDASQLYQKEEFTQSAAKFLEMTKFNEMLQTEFLKLPSTMLTLSAGGNDLPLQVTGESKFFDFKGPTFEEAARELQDGDDVYFRAGDRDGKKVLTGLSTKKKEGFNPAKFKKVDAGKWSLDIEDRIRGSLVGLDNLSRLSRSEIAYRAGNFDTVLDAKHTGGTVARLEQLGAQPGPITLKDFDITGKMLGLALRANVQKGNVAQGKTILKLIERLAPAEGVLVTPASADILRALIFDMRVQVNELKKNPDDRAKLEEVIKNYSAFLKDYAESAGKKGLSLAEILFMGDCYESMQNHAKAAEYYKQIPKTEWMDKAIPRNPKLKPDTEEWRKEKEVTDKIEQEIGIYCKARLKLAQQLRAEKKDIDALQIITDLKKHPNVRGLIYIEKENNLIFEDNKLWGKAIGAWAAYMKNPGLQNAMKNDLKFKTLYFEAYVHHAKAWYHYSQLDKVKKAGKEKDYLDTAAEYFLRLEYSANPEGWSLAEREIRQILDAEPILKKRYQELKPKYEEKKKAK